MKLSSSGIKNSLRVPESGVNARRYALYHKLPDEFDRATYDRIVEERRENASTASKWIEKFIEDLGIQGKSSLVFVIGGSLGLSDNVLKRADYQISFSKMTFPHQLMRVILSEQIYRAMRIMKNEPYHK